METVRIMKRDDFVPSPEAEGRAPHEKKGDIGPYPRSHAFKFLRAQTQVPKQVEPQQRRGCVAASTPKARGQRDSLSQEELRSG